jgi:hypothetical protein
VRVGVGFVPRSEALSDEVLALVNSVMLVLLNEKGTDITNHIGCRKV